jgi:transposase
MFDPSRIKFGDEKHLKGQELYNRNVRRDPITGFIPDTYTNGDFCNTYALTGFCGIDRASSPVWYSIHEDKNGADEFALQLEMALASGFFRPGDILVLDNASIHNGGDNNILEEWLWDNFGVLLLFLPARSPELNPIEQVWKLLVNRLKRLRFYQLSHMKRLKGVTHIVIIFKCNSYFASYFITHIIQTMLSSLTHLVRQKHWLQPYTATTVKIITTKLG